VTKVLLGAIARSGEREEALADAFGLTASTLGLNGIVAPAAVIFWGGASKGTHPTAGHPKYFARSLSPPAD